MTTHNLRPWCLIGAALLLGAGLTGCRSNDPPGAKADPWFGQKAILSIHSFSQTPTAQSSPFGLEYAPGRYLFVDQQPLVDSSGIARIEIVPTAGGKGLRCYLASQGQFRWQQACTNWHGYRLVLLVNGRFRAFVRVSGSGATGLLDLPGPFSAEEAEALVNGAGAKR